MYFGVSSFSLTGGRKLEEFRPPVQLKLNTPKTV
jgi:hypothetical protein